MSLTYRRPDKLLLKNHPQYNELWLRDRILDDPSVLGLGDVDVRAVEIVQPVGGRLDLLLRNPETGKRYEVEIMLGTVDESHIIRTIEYWDVERRRYPQYDHTAVIVAEKITARFLNVINLFNGAIPLIAIQLTALQIGDSIALDFTKVLDEIALGTDEEEESAGQSVDRSYWENKGSKKSLTIADECLSVLREINQSLDLNYTVFYIGLRQDGRSNNFMIFRAKKEFLRAEVRVSDREGWTSRLEEAGFVTLPGETVKERVHFRIGPKDVTEHRELLKDLFSTSYRETQE